MKSTKYIYKVLMVFLLAHFPIYAQYTGGSSDGNSSREIINAVCGTPAHYYAYFGGNGDGEAVNTLINATCSTPPGGFAYLGGIGDGASVNTIQNTTCGLPPGAYAYTGGSGDANGLYTLMNQTCPFPPQFWHGLARWIGYRGVLAGTSNRSGQNQYKLDYPVVLLLQDYFVLAV